MPEFDEKQGERPLRPRGRRAAPKSRVARVVEPLAPTMAVATAWASTHRLGAMMAICGIATVAMLGGGIALIQQPGAGISEPEPDADSYSMLDDPRPTTTAPAAPSPFGPILPTPAPPQAAPAPEQPDEAVEPPVDEPIVEPAPSVEPGRGDGPGRGNGPKKPKE
ncbi:hypothetical protein [Agromyces ramosus]|uniref:hypothetical protein n=1 Tax=Agromyces ramosus TaxID=33879 RepID=UPI0027D8D724|nr:hypothetical protein [Agromyces ramosus]